MELYCQRCPVLQSASDYTLLLVAVSDARRHRSSDLQLLPVRTRDVTPPTFLTAPTVSDIGESNFTLTLSLSEPGEKRLHHPLLLCGLLCGTICSCLQSSRALVQDKVLH